MRRKAAERRRAAFHEAGHAVARVYFGYEPTPVEIGTHGSGYAHGTGLPIDRRDFMAIVMAGPFAEARFRKCARVLILLTSGHDDYQCVRSLLDEEAAMYAAAGAPTNTDVAYEYVEGITGIFLRESWPDIERVAAALLERGRLEASDVAALIGSINEA